MIEPSDRRSRRNRNSAPAAAPSATAAYVQACLAHVGFPETLPQLRRAWEVGGGYTDMELLLDPPPGHSGGWTAPPWLTTGDILIFYHTKRAMKRIRTLLAAARDASNPEWAVVNDRAASIEFIEDQLTIAEHYAGKIFGVSEVAGAAAFEKGDTDRFWRGNIYAPI